jgi:hypothetical protein
MVKGSDAHPLRDGRARCGSAFESLARKSNSDAATKIGLDNLRNWLERDVITMAFDAALQVGDGVGLSNLIEIFV